MVFTDIGGDVDDAAALVFLAICDPDLCLVVTVDEYPDHRRAKFARHLLNLLGRSDVRVVAGVSLGASGYWSADGLYPPDLQIPQVDVYDVIAELFGWDDTPIPCLSLGPLTDIACLLIADARQRRPLRLAQRLRLTAMGGALHGYRTRGKAEHNWRMNPAAVQLVLAYVVHIVLVLSDHTFVDEIAVSKTSSVYRLLARSSAPWASLLREHYDQFFRRFYESSKLHDALAASLALGQGFVRCEQREFRLGRDARMYDGPGIQAWLSTGADYAGFMSQFEETLRAGPADPPTFDHLMSEIDRVTANSRAPAPHRESGQ